MARLQARASAGLPLFDDEPDTLPVLRSARAYRRTGGGCERWVGQRWVAYRWQKGGRVGRRGKWVYVGSARTRLAARSLWQQAKNTPK